MPDPTRAPPDSVPTADLVLDARPAGEPTIGPADVRTPEPARPITLPGYELLGEVGRGGMGIVYRARDLSLNRDIAVKLLQDKYPPHGLAAHRFVEEARITGQLQHPGIPPVHAVGTLPDGRPFIAMKLIKGDTLADLLAARKFGRGALVAVFEQVCQAVGYAHTHGVVHRDLKPQNVMVGGFGEVQVMDWGLAKFRAAARAGSVESSMASTFYDPRDDADESLRTRDGSFLGTPAYMSPEQAVGAVDRVDARSDVFGLGAVLCAILTGQPPFTGETAESTRQLAARGKLDAAYALLDACGAEPELVLLCKRCLSAEPADRPAGAGEVAKAVAELRAAADDRARQAELGRAAVVVQIAEQRKRRRWQLALTGAVLVIVTGGGAVAWWHQRQARERQQEQDLAVERSRQAADAGVTLAATLREKFRYGEARTALDQAAAQTADGAPAAIRDRVNRAQGDLALVRDLDEIRIRRLLLDEPRHLRTIIPAAYRAAFRGHGLDPAGADPAELGRITDSPVKRDLVAAIDDWALYEPDPGVRDRLLAVTRQSDPGPWSDRLRHPAVWADQAALADLAAGADVSALPPHLIVLLYQVQRAPWPGGRSALVMAANRHRDDFWVQLEAGFYFLVKEPTPALAVGYFRAALALRPAHAAVLWMLATALVAEGDRDSAVALSREVVALRPEDAVARRGLADVLNAVGDADGAIAAYRAAVQLDPMYAFAHRGLGDALLSKPDADGAAAAYRDAIRHDPGSAPAHRGLGDALRAKGDLPGAVAAYRDAIRYDARYTWAHGALGRVLFEQNDMDGAIPAFRTAIRLDPQYSWAHLNLGHALSQTGNWTGAIPSYKDAIRLDPKLTVAHLHLGLALQRTGDPDGGIACFREARRLEPNNIDVLGYLGVALRNDRRDYEGATECFRDVMRLDSKLAWPHKEEGLVLQARGDLDGAIRCYREAVRIDPKFTRSYLHLASALRATGDHAREIASYRDALRFDPDDAATHNNVAWRLAVGPGGVRDGRQAVEHATRACELTGWMNPDSVDTLAAAYAEAGDFDKAVKYQQEALGYPKFPAADVSAARQRLELYIRKKPYRETIRVVAPLPRSITR